MAIEDPRFPGILCFPIDGYGQDDDITTVLRAKNC